MKAVVHLPNYNIVNCMCVTVDGVWIGKRIYWPLIPHDSELQVITAPPLISTIHKSPWHPLSLFEPAVFTSRSLAKTSNSEDSSSSRTQVPPSLTPIQNCLPAISSTELDSHLFSASLAQLNCTQHSPAKPQLSSFITTLHGPNRKHCIQQYLYCCLRICCSGNVFTEPLPSSGRLPWLHYSGLQASCHNM
jgi:hypothetical protein